ncbi:MAG: membrane protein insertion efficiency factor YidD [Vicinamibacterales bacterium]|nr:membrane protein insertion efficiency factor YidD [Vicinamibacterales bacterium]
MSSRWRRRIAALVLLAALGWDLSRPPAAQWSAAAAIAGIRLYQRVLSPLVSGAGVRCRFSTSCSHYAEVVIRRDGLLKGSWRAATRIVRCGPWTPAGTVDNP